MWLIILTIPLIAIYSNYRSPKGEGSFLDQIEDLVTNGSRCGAGFLP
jgi:hypothetical protein